ncbi:Na+/H+ antiporter subunit E [Oceanobacillus jeddahense]|uniref:Na+/H+ antiporter subunit E n=1 Tax=Oceanobacillus jeddahense TaxID=1462527 RepID=A0ABY5JR83_9BACI|nr:Na+/H+ antiporter subunit E [Oceanobacillus jeddahense]UUI02744.1 Na+/H+ antiporter subunit E [Oceanobacillus jeddahense]
MPAQFLLNVFIAVLWTLINDESELRFTTFVAGYLVGVGIVFLMHRFFGERFYLSRFFALIKLIFIFTRELIMSSKLVLGQILKPKLSIKPGLFKYETVLQGDWEITTLALLLTLTPGSVVIEVTDDGDAFYIHAMDVEESKDILLKSIDTFERAIMEVTR